MDSPLKPTTDISAEALRVHVQAILRSPEFARSRRLQRFLEFIVEAKLEGRIDDIQEYVIGLEVFDRKESFDPRSDSIVRVEARRLRERLKAYYDDVGNSDSIQITLPSRGYAPEFGRRALPAGKRPMRTKLALAAASALALLAGVLAFNKPVPDRDPRALAAVEKGNFAFDEWTEQGALAARQYFEEAIALEPDFALAYCGLSRSYRQAFVMGDSHFEEALPASLRAAQKAFELDPTLAEAHWNLAGNYVYYCDWEKSGFHYEQAVRLAPDNAMIHEAYGTTYLAAVGRLSAAERELRRATTLEPAVLSHRAMLGKILYFQGKYERAEQALREVLGIRPHFPDALRNLGPVLVKLGRYEEAVEAFRQAQTLAYLSWGDGLLANAQAAAGEEEEARETVARLIEQAQQGEAVSALGIATGLVGLGDVRQSYKWFRRALDQHETRVRYLAVDPLYEALRGEREFEEILESLRLSSAGVR